MSATNDVKPQTKVPAAEQDEQALNLPPIGTSPHRAYITFHPTCNKIVAKKWDDLNRSIHLQKLRQTKPTIDNAPPRACPHLQVNMRKNIMERGKNQSTI